MRRLLLLLYQCVNIFFPNNHWQNSVSIFYLPDMFKGSNVGFTATCLSPCWLRARGLPQNLLQAERAAWHTDWSNFQPVESNTATMRLFSLQSLHCTLFYLTAHQWSDHGRGWCHFLTVARILTSCLKCPPVLSYLMLGLLSVSCLLSCSC